MVGELLIESADAQPALAAADALRSTSVWNVTMAEEPFTLTEQVLEALQAAINTRLAAR